MAEKPELNTRRELEELYALSLEEQVKRSCETSYYAFFQRAWQVLEPRTPLKDNWHIKYLCDILQHEIERIAARKPKTKDLIFNICPRSAKSYIVSIMLTPWAWINAPFLRIISTSHSAPLSTEHCKKSRDLIDSPWYQGYWSDKFQMTTDQNVKSLYENTKRGKRQGTSLKGAITGFGGDIITMDDLVDPKMASSTEALISANEYHDKTLYSRLDDQDIGLRIAVMQRLHEDDLTGHCLKKFPNDYTHICIPGELEGADVYPAELEKNYVDGLFFPERFTREYLDRLKKAGRRFYVGQILQRPAEKEGNVYKRADFRWYYQLPDKLDKIIQSWDMTFKEGKKNSFVCGQVWAKKGTQRLLLDEWRAQTGFKGAIRAMLAMKAKWPNSENIYVEDKANGPAIIETLKETISGLIPVPPKGSKYARAEATSFMVEGGNVLLPHPTVAPWIEDWLDEITSFPNTTVNDRVDCTSQGLSEMKDDSVYEDYQTLLAGLGG